MSHCWHCYRLSSNRKSSVKWTMHLNPALSLDERVCTADAALLTPLHPQSARSNRDITQTADTKHINETSQNRANGGCPASFFPSPRARLAANCPLIELQKLVRQNATRLSVSHWRAALIGRLAVGVPAHPETTLKLPEVTSESHQRVTIPLFSCCVSHLTTH